MSGEGNQEMSPIMQVLDDARNPQKRSMTPYQRLQVVADLRYDDTEDEKAYQLVLDKIKECTDLVTEYEQNNGYHSQDVRSAISEWANSFRSDLQQTQSQLEGGHQSVVQARTVMRDARDKFNTNVSDELLSPAEQSFKDSLDGVPTIFKVAVPSIGIVDVASDWWFDNQEKKREKERNEYCQSVLDQMNQQLKQGADGMQANIDKGGKNTGGDCSPTTAMPGITDPNDLGAGGIGGGLDGYDPSAIGDGSGVGGYDPSGLGTAGSLGGSSGLGAAGSLGGSSGLGTAGSLGGSTSDNPYAAGNADWMSDGSQRSGLSQDDPSHTNLDGLDTDKLLESPINQTVTPNGAIGGYTPPSATDYSDPRWDPSYKIPSSVTDMSKAASAGALGAGAASALKGLGGASGLGAAGAAGAKGGAAGLGAGAGLKGAGAGLKGAAGANGAGMMGMGGAGAGAGAGAPGDDKKKKRRGFSGLFSDQTEDTGPVWDPAHGPGSEDDGIVFEIDLDEWGL